MPSFMKSSPRAPGTAVDSFRIAICRSRPLAPSSAEVLAAAPGHNVRRRVACGYEAISLGQDASFFKPPFNIFSIAFLMASLPERVPGIVSCDEYVSKRAYLRESPGSSPQWSHWNISPSGAYLPWRRPPFFLRSRTTVGSGEATFLILVPPYGRTIHPSMGRWFWYRFCDRSLPL